MTTDLCNEIVYKDYGKSTALTELNKMFKGWITENAKP